MGRASQSGRSNIFPGWKRTQLNARSTARPTERTNERISSPSFLLLLLRWEESDSPFLSRRSSSTSKTSSNLICVARDKKENVNLQVVRKILSFQVAESGVRGGSPSGSQGNNSWLIQSKGPLPDPFLTPPFPLYRQTSKLPSKRFIKYVRRYFPLL